MNKVYAISLGMRGHGEDVIGVADNLSTAKEFADRNKPEGASDLELAWHNSDPQKRWLTESFVGLHNGSVEQRYYFLITKVAKV